MVSKIGKFVDIKIKEETWISKDNYHEIWGHTEILLVKTCGRNVGNMKLSFRRRRRKRG